jgi:hypothetical protein
LKSGIFISKTDQKSGESGMTATLTTQFIGESGVHPQIARLDTSDTYAVITTAGYLNSVAQTAAETLSPNDIVLAYYDNDGTPGFGFFAPSFSGSVITLVPTIDTGITLPTVANHLVVTTNTTGDMANRTGAALNDGDLQAGRSGVAGSFISYPATASKGSLKVTGVANTGDTVTTISNAAMGQTSTITIPDPAGAAANFAVAPAALVNGNLVQASGTAGLVQDAGMRIISNTTAAYAGGGTSNTFTATGLTSSAKGTPTIRTSTNSVSITKALPGTDSLAITFSADPGANTTVDYIYTTAAHA